MKVYLLVMDACFAWIKCLVWKVHWNLFQKQVNY